MSYAVRVSNIPESLLYPVDGVQISKVANSQKYTINVQYAVQIQLDDSENYKSIIKEFTFPNIKPHALISTLVTVAVLLDQIFLSTA